MTLSQIRTLLPLDYNSGCQYGLLFSADLANRLAEVQEEAGAKFRVAPRALPNGKFLLSGDLLSEVGPGGLYAAGFSRLDASRFDEIEIVPWADAVALLPPDPAE